MAINSTFVASVNGLTGTIPFNMEYVQQEGNSHDYMIITGPTTPPMRVLTIDATDIPVTGTSGQNIQQNIRNMASTVRPMIMEQIDDTDDYIAHLGAGIPYEPATT